MSNSNFVREHRYIVVKLSDANVSLSEVEKEQMDSLLLKIAEHRTLHAKQILDCVVVESDWPIYDEVWRLVEKHAMNRG